MNALLKKPKNDYPKYANARECLEHFRFATILHRHTPMPQSFVQHIKEEISRFEKLKVEGNEKRKLLNRKTISKLDDMLTTAVKNNINKKDFSIAVKTEKTDEGLMIENYLIYKNEDEFYDIIDTETDVELFYDINQFKLAYLLTVATIEGKTRNDIEVKQLIDNNNQYSNLLESIDENHRKLEISSTDKEKSTIETIVSGLKDQLNILDQLISAQYTHKNNSLKA